jgi:hypothetical protein
MYVTNISQNKIIMNIYIINFYFNIFDGATYVPTLYVWTHGVHIHQSPRKEQMLKKFQCLVWLVVRTEFLLII